MRTVTRLDSGREALNELWYGNLSHIKTTYGQLVYLAGLRNPDSGRYEHYGAPAESPNSEASHALRRIHESIFRQWVTISLEQKKADIELYISLIDVERAALIDAWIRLTPYKNLVPAAIQGPERQKHISDFEAILGLLKNVYGVASPNPGV